MRARGKQITQFQRGWKWIKAEERLYSKMLKGFSPILHVFSGKSRFGDIRIDKDPFIEATHHLEVKPEIDFKLPFKNQEFDATIFDPPWINSYFVWASREIPRVTKRRIVAISGNFWYSVQSKAFELSRVYVVKMMGPLAKLVFVYDAPNKTL